MVDVKTYQCFPTLIHEFHGEQTTESHTNMLNVIELESKTDDLHQRLAFKDFIKRVLECNKYVLDADGYAYEKIEITNMWGTTLLDGDSHWPHTHSNNTLSGVYYLQASKNTSPIQFFDPRPQASVWQPRIKKPNCHNSSRLQFESVVGVGFIFPSWLMHWVPPTPEKRVSISWNVIVRGDYGEPNTFQNAHI